MQPNFNYPFMMSPEFLTLIKNNLANQLTCQLDLNSMLMQQARPCGNELAPGSEGLVKISLSEEEGLRKPADVVAPKKEPRFEREIVSMQSKMKNDTKNIPKNYGKAILSFIQKNTHQTKKLLQREGVSFAEFMSQVRKNKQKANSIADMRSMWG